MRLRRSLRLYFVLAMVAMGSSAIVGMSGVAVSYFFSGMDEAMRGFIHSQAFHLDVAPGQVTQQDDLLVAKRWQDLPTRITQHFDQEDLADGRLLKHIEGIPLLSPPKKGYFVMQLEQDGERRFAAIEIGERDRVTPMSRDELPPFFYIVFTAIGAIALFSVVLLMIIRNVSAPVEQLGGWAKSLDEDKLDAAIPNFHYRELNALAEMIQSSLRSVQASVEREKRFLGYASHELRTPIAVTRTNTELLGKMIDRQVEPAKQREVLARIERASLTMTDLTETLLWLNRREEKALPSASFSIGQLVIQIRQELNYLLHGKAVTVAESTDDTQMTLPSGLTRIVITNLVRNAFQHTQKGQVVISQTGDTLVIENHNDTDQERDSDLGFGLGLELTDRLVKQQGWSYCNTVTANGRVVTVRFGG